MRETDEPNVPHDLHHWLSRLDDEVKSLHTGQNNLLRDVNDLRLAVAQTGKPNWAIVAVFVVQTAGAVYWGGSMSAQMANVIQQTQHLSTVVEEHVRTAGPVRANAERCERLLGEMEGRVRTVESKQQVVLQRLDQIDKRNTIADANWEKIRAKGYLVESTK